MAAPKRLGRIEREVRALMEKVNLTALAALRAMSGASTLLRQRCNQTLSAEAASLRHCNGTFASVPWLPTDGGQAAAPHFRRLFSPSRPTPGNP